MEQTAQGEDGKACFDLSDFSCAELCIESESAEDYVNLMRNLIRERIGQCNRYGVWMKRLDVLDRHLNLTLAGQYKTQKILTQLISNLRLPVLDRRS